MSQIGYYRYKIDNLTKGINEISIYVNGNLATTHTIDVRESCEQRKLIKYLDKNGQYRYYAFNSYYETKDKPKLLGKANRLITSILTSQANEKNIGYSNERTISLIADEVTSDEMEFLQDLWLSPRVYLHIGTNNNDEAKDWLEVTVSGGNPISKWRKQHTGKVSIDIELPKWFSISML